MQRCGGIGKIVPLNYCHVSDDPASAKAYSVGALRGSLGLDVFVVQANPRTAFAGWVHRLQKAYKDNAEVPA